MMCNSVCKWWLMAAVAVSACAQNGDKKGETQQSRVPAEIIPPSPPLAPADALKSFRVAPGFKIQMVAHEPDVQVPIALQFDPDGRIWVLEMRGFMPNAMGTNEDQPVGRVSILEDVNGDGAADKTKVFLDGLVMPRAFLLVRGGLLLAEPPRLWFYPIQDDKPGERVVVDEEYASGADTKLGTRANPEHSANSLTLAIDNWIYSMDHTRRYRFENGQWIKEANPRRAQYGLSQDNYGRLFYNSNSDQLRGDLVPSHYALKGVPTVRLPGVGVQIAKDQAVWPARINPGVNRGYQAGTLRNDFTLARFTAACGTSIYRGDALPDCLGNAFLCEPSANVVRRNILNEKDGAVTARNAYEKSEFVASTDELFRPVNTYTGPDGALYIVDMYHGIIQHRVFLTSYLRKQAESRGLDKVTAHGRIYRVTHESKPVLARPSLSKASSADLVKELAHPNGWRRDTAQRLLVERNDASALEALRQAATGNANPLARLHALWTLEGLKQTDTPLLVTMLDDKDAKVRAAAVRVSEGSLRSAALQTNELRKHVLACARDKTADVQIQLALTLGAIPEDDASKAALKTLAQSSFNLARDAANFSIAARTAKPAVAAASKGPKLSPAEMKRFEAGKGNYEAVCLPCHQPHGMGQEGLAPPLVGSEWLKSEQKLTRILLHGLRGPIKVKGQAFELDMPALGVLEDEQIATILTYIRNEWGHSFAPVSNETVKKVREVTADRSDAWTQEELATFK
jgi:mono/diheme cytochrome c family protein/glucose/arabinose dehydrogenase